VPHAGISMDDELPHEVVPYTPFAGASFKLAVDQELLFESGSTSVVVIP